MALPTDAAVVKSTIAAGLYMTPDALADELTLEELGLGSMALAEALRAVERRYRVALRPDLIAGRLSPVMTVRDLVTMLCELLERSDVAGAR